MEIRHANFYRGPALGGIDRGNLDPNDSEVVELHRSSLFYRDRYLGVGTNVIRCGYECSDQRTRGSRKGGCAYVELGYDISCYRADRRCFGS